jgi:hypothetical protein
MDWPEFSGIRRPRRRDDVPVLWRSSTSIQIGDAVVVSGVDRSHVDWLTRLDGLASADQVIQRTDIAVADARRLARALRAAGALEDAASLPDSVRWAARTGRDVALRRHGAALAVYRDPVLTEAALARREATRVHVRGDGDVARAVELAVESAGLRLVAEPRATVIVLADGRHPDVTSDASVPDQPHLPVAVFGARGVAGPLVVPGHTSCLTCAHLHRRDEDGAWPLLAVQWSQDLVRMTTPPVDPLLVAAVAVHGVLLLRTWAEADPGTTDDRWSDRAVEVLLPAGVTRIRSRPPHPLCGCRWQAPLAQGA